MKPRLSREQKARSQLPGAKKPRRKSNESEAKGEKTAPSWEQKARSKNMEQKARSKKP